MINNIQALRFFAAMAVLIYHVSSIYNHYNGGVLSPITNALDPYGRVGVDLFFVISGLVIWLSTNKRHDSRDAFPFLLNRYARIFVTYWPMLIFAVLIDVSFRDISLDRYDIFQSIFLLPSEFGGIGKLALPVSWTLTYELVFYTVFAILMCISRKVSMFFMLAWGAVCLSGLGPKGTLFSPHIAEFAAGCLIGALVPSIRRARLYPVAMIMLAGALFCFGAYGTGTWSRVIWFGSFSVVVIVLAIWLEEHGIKASNYYLALGGMSYSLYLCHFPIMQAFSHQWQLVKAHPEWMLMPIIPISLLISWGWWRYVETPLNNSIRSSIKRKL